MEVAAGLIAPEGEFSRLLRSKFDLRDLVPVCMELSIIVFPSIFQIRKALLFYDEFYRITVKKEPMRPCSPQSLKVSSQIFLPSR
jgi:hypothetical protein